LRLSILLLGLLAFSTAQLDSTSVLLIGLNQFEPVDLPDTEDDIISECQQTEPIPEYPIAAGNLFAPASTFIDGMVMVCGGFDGVDNYGDCFGISPELGEWIRLAPMMKSVFRAGFSKFGNAEEEGEFFWVAGGTTNGVDVVSTSQIYDAGTRSWFPGPNLPLPLDGSCLAKLDNTHTLVTGGEQAGGAANWIYNFDDYMFTPVGDFVGGNRFVHGCATLADGRVMVAGGYQAVNTPEATVLNTVEIFDPVTRTWSEGPAFPGDGRDGLVLVGVTTGAWAGDVLLLGGHIPDSITGGDWIESDEVARYKTAENEWEVLDYKMKIPREHFSVVSTPYHCDED